MIKIIKKLIIIIFFIFLLSINFLNTRIININHSYFSNKNFYFKEKKIVKLSIFDIIFKSKNKSENELTEEKYKNFIENLKNLKIKIFSFFINENSKRFIKEENQVLFAKLYLENILTNSLNEAILKMENKISNTEYTQEIINNYIPKNLKQKNSFFYNFYFIKKDQNYEIYLFLTDKNFKNTKYFIIKKDFYDIFYKNNILISENLQSKFFYINVYAETYFFEYKTYIYNFAPKFTILDWMLIISVLISIILSIISIDYFYNLLLNKKNLLYNSNNNIPNKINNNNVKYYKLNQKNNEIKNIEINKNFTKNPNKIEKNEILYNNYKEYIKETNIENIEKNIAEKNNFDFNKEYEKIEKEILNL
jgi:hypothetical protein